MLSSFRRIVVEIRGRSGSDEASAAGARGARAVADGAFLELGDHGVGRHAHEVGGGHVGVLAVEEPDGGAVRFPPERLGDVVGGGEVDLRGDDAALVVDAHEGGHGQVKGQPGGDPGLEVAFGGVDGRED